MLLITYSNRFTKKLLTIVRNVNIKDEDVNLIKFNRNYLQMSYDNMTIIEILEYNREIFIKFIQKENINF
ncbi:MAG: hypothetical protein ACOC2W_03785 [bacterium]